MEFEKIFTQIWRATLSLNSKIEKGGNIRARGVLEHQVEEWHL